MKREITAAITGDVDALMREWKPPSGVELMRFPGEVHVVFRDDNLPAYDELEAIAARIVAAHPLQVESFYRAFDFSPDDLRASELLWMRIPSTPGLEVTGKKPIEEIPCDKCGMKRSVIKDVGRIELGAQGLPTKPLLAAQTLKFASREILDGLKNSKLDHGLRAVSCTVSVRGKELDDAYSWITGTVDLGDPAGNVDLTPPCEKCGLRSISSNRTFLWAFLRSRWNEEDFCTSSFFGLDTLYVSQRVFRHLETSSASKSSGAIFEPIELK